MHRNGEIVFRNAVTFDTSHEQKLTSETPTSLPESPDGTFIASGSDNEAFSRAEDTRLWSFAAT